MEKIGIFYSTETAKTATVASDIISTFGKDNVEIVPIETAWKEDFEKYKYIIAGTSTWFDGELPAYWDELLSELKTLNLKGKHVAIFGLGDQVNYPENFADGVGLLAETFISCGAKLVGFTSLEGYEFERSLATKDGKFQGLIIDVENQYDETKQRIKDWVDQLKIAFQQKDVK